MNFNNGYSTYNVPFNFNESRPYRYRVISL